MKRPSFTEINALVQELVPDPGQCDFGPFNAYKLFQHAIASYSLEDRKAIINYKLHWPVAFQHLKYVLKSAKGYPAAPSLRTIVFRDDARRGSDQSGIQQSFYLHRFQQSLDREQYTLIAQPASPKEDIYDIAHAETEALRSAPLFRDERRILKELRQLAARSAKWLPAEVMPYLYSKLQVFFESFHRCYHFFYKQPTTRLIMTTHYHNEGEIAAAKMLGIKVIEVQHGLISPLDVYYCYPESLQPYASRALFADHIIVFGEYWKRMLSQGAEYAEERIHIAGDYTIAAHKSTRRAKKKEDKQNILLICAQKNLSADYVPYLEFLLDSIAPKYPEWEFWVKLHPLEREVEKYIAFSQKAQCRIIGNEGDLDELLDISKIQVTIYSTTLYDALGKNVVNFALQDYGKFADYAASMIDTGVALPLRNDDDPIQKFISIDNAELPLKRVDVYAPFKPEVFLSLVDEI